MLEVSPTYSFSEVKIEQKDSLYRYHGILFINRHMFLQVLLEDSQHGTRFTIH